MELLLHYAQEDCVQQETQSTQRKSAQAGTGAQGVRTRTEDPYKINTIPGQVEGHQCGPSLWQTEGAPGAQRCGSSAHREST